MIRFALCAWAAAAALTAAVPALGETAGHGGEHALEQAAVVIDGREIARVRGIAGLPAAERAARIEERIREAARDASIDPASLQVVESPEASQILAGTRLLMGVFDADAELEGMDRQALAAVEMRLIREAIVNYRAARSPQAVRGGVRQAAIATAALVAAVVLIVWVSRRLSAFAIARWKPRVLTMRVPGLEIAPGTQLWTSLAALGRGLRFLALALCAYVYLGFTLRQFAATRHVGDRLAGYLVDPLVSMWRAFVAELPSLLFLLVLFFVVRVVLRVLRLYFATLASGAVRVEGFHAQWTGPTYRLIRIGVIAFALVVAYPYIPGSESEAFKGLSIFAGVLLSIGSSSFVANYVAGYTLIYRRPFSTGDFVRIGDTFGEVVEMRVQATRLRTLKNEEVILPNSMILNTPVTNYSSYANGRGLVLHTTVGIGYEVPWRQVEGMLLTAAERTEGVLKDPPPFVLQKGLGDFAVNYELNAFVATAEGMSKRYSELHAHVLDVFNEYGVQIMTPAYEGDTPEPKLVPRERWNEAPSRRPAT